MLSPIREERRIGPKDARLFFLTKNQTFMKKYISCTRVVHSFYSKYLYEVLIFITVYYIALLKWVLEKEFRLRTQKSPSIFKSKKRPNGDQRSFSEFNLLPSHQIRIHRRI